LTVFQIYVQKHITTGSFGDLASATVTPIKRGSNIY